MPRPRNRLEWFAGGSLPQRALTTIPVPASDPAPTTAFTSPPKSEASTSASIKSPSALTKTSQSPQKLSWQLPRLKLVVSSDSESDSGNESGDILTETSASEDEHKKGKNRKRNRRRKGSPQTKKVSFADARGAEKSPKGILKPTAQYESSPISDQSKEERIKIYQHCPKCNSFWEVDEFNGSVDEDDNTSSIHGHWRPALRSCDKWDWWYRCPACRCDFMIKDGWIFPDGEDPYPIFSSDITSSISKGSLLRRHDGFTGHNNNYRNDNNANQGNRDRNYPSPRQIPNSCPNFSPRGSRRQPSPQNSSPPYINQNTQQNTNNDPNSNQNNSIRAPNTPWRETGSMASRLISRVIEPRRAAVIIREDVIELPSDPVPNAYFDPSTGYLRVYHGPMYGNPLPTLSYSDPNYAIGTDPSMPHWVRGNQRAAPFVGMVERGTPGGSGGYGPYCGPPPSQGNNSGSGYGPPQQPQQQGNNSSGTWNQNQNQGSGSWGNNIDHQNNSGGGWGGNPNNNSGWDGQNDNSNNNNSSNSNVNWDSSNNNNNNQNSNGNWNSTNQNSNNTWASNNQNTNDNWNSSNNQNSNATDNWNTTNNNNSNNQNQNISSPHPSHASFNHPPHNSSPNNNNSSNWGYNNQATTDAYNNNNNNTVVSGGSWDQGGAGPTQNSNKSNSGNDGGGGDGWGPMPEPAPWGDQTAASSWQGGNNNNNNSGW